MGLSGASSRNIAQFVMDEFNVAGSPDSTTPELLFHLIDRISSATATFRSAVQGYCGLERPAEAPAKWMNRGDRLPGETPITFLERVWGRHIHAGLIYQCDIADLGDPDLCPAIRSYCQRNDLSARDYLPPPKRVKIDRLFLAAAPGSAEEAELEQTVRARLPHKHLRLQKRC